MTVSKKFKPPADTLALNATGTDRPRREEGRDDRVRRRPRGSARRGRADGNRDDRAATHGGDGSRCRTQGVGPAGRRHADRRRDRRTDL